MLKKFDCEELQADPCAVRDLFVCELHLQVKDQPGESELGGQLDVHVFIQLSHYLLPPCGHSGLHNLRLLFEASYGVPPLGDSTGDQCGLRLVAPLLPKLKESNSREGDPQKGPHR